jgi:hypothetical protein
MRDTQDWAIVRLCFSNSGDERGGQDVYVVYRALNAWWTMQPNPGTPLYSYKSGVLSNITGDVVMPAVFPPASDVPGMDAFDAMVNAWRLAGSGDMGSDPADPATSVRSRAEALASSTRGGAGQFEQINPFTAPTAGFYGVVLTNQSGTAGTCQLLRSG